MKKNEIRWGTKFLHTLDGIEKYVPGQRSLSASGEPFKSANGGDGLPRGEEVE